MATAIYLGALFVAGAIAGGRSISMGWPAAWTMAFDAATVYWLLT